MGGNFDNFAPVARIDDLVTTESGNELLVYDTKNSELHHLDELSTFVWQNLDGGHTVADLVVMAKAESHANVTDESIRLAIAVLGNINLLASDVPDMATGVSQSRRRFLKKAAIAGAAVPVIASVTMPAAHASGTVDATCTGECTALGNTCNCTCPAGLTVDLGLGVCLLGIGVCAAVCI